LGIGPNPQSPIPNPQSPIPNPQNNMVFNLINFYPKILIKVRKIYLFKNFI